ncbi:4-vinyl reductase [Nannocystis pusilla]|uniref:4-vinyl reductase n=1 Tax=Nannocystis pusilla TaxID=889268 RepID=A0ABS7TN07_9BACT|nr:4-vinyl reductase [Nannocystis pusilla]MBZ5709599.1 4-vinyl reductase [Nannocystis pusilla]
MVTEISALAERLVMHYDAPSGRRVIAGKDVLLHCHHYNARLQRTVESADLVDGKRLIVGAAECVFAEYIDLALSSGDSPAARWALAERLYSHLGFGRLDFSRADEGVVVGPASHFVEGWFASLGRPERMVCSFAEGYIQGAVHAITGELVHARELECMARGAPACRFAVERGRTDPIARNSKRPLEFRAREGGEWLRSPAIDEQAILDALVAMPIAGGDDGLIPAFGVYLACMPADFYNRVCIGFLAEMRRVGRGATGERLLVAEAEYCALNTFRGVMSSPEWESLVAPMLRGPDDPLFATMAFSNALGYGHWHITGLDPGQSMRVESVNGYEAIGAREYLGITSTPLCHGHKGAAAGIFALIYGEGPMTERFGTFHAVEEACIACGDPVCRFRVERVG